MNEPYFFNYNNIKHDGNTVLYVEYFLSELKEVFEKHGIKEIEGGTISFSGEGFGITKATITLKQNGGKK